VSLFLEQQKVMGKTKLWRSALGLWVVLLFNCFSTPSLLADSNQAPPFQASIDIDATLSGAHSVQTADLDLDGDLDVIAAGRNDGRVRWYQNNGASSPTFALFEVGVVQGAYSVYPADLDGDGDSDLVAAGVGELMPSQNEQAVSNTGSIVWFENNLRTTGLFTPYTLVGGLPYPVVVLAADLDRDGDQDVLSTWRDGNAVVWYENNGARPPVFVGHFLNNNLPGAVSVHVGDLEGDGDLDVVSAAENANRISWLVNDGAAFPNFVEYPILQFPQGEVDYAKAAYAADIDGDGDTDVAYAAEESNEIGWLENLGGSPPLFEKRQLATDVIHAKTVVALDVDRDGDVDLLATSSDGNTVFWFEQIAAKPPAFQRRVVSDAVQGARAVHAADLDQDGDLDLLSASRADNRIVWYPNRTIHRTALYSTNTRTFIATYPSARSVYAADMDRDGDMDVLSVADAEVAWHENNDAFPPAFVTHPIANNLDGGRWVYAADLDRDGDMDVVAASKVNDQIFWYQNQGGTPPTFAGYLVTNRAQGPRSVLAADLDSDGDMDLYSASDDDNTIAWYENTRQPNNLFIRREVTDKARYARSAYAADLDSDGDLDLMSASQHDDKVAWYENQGGAPLHFETHIIATNADGVQHIHADDLDHDGDMDIVAASEYDNSIRWYENLRGAPLSFVEHFVTQAAPAVHAIYTGDADGDGDVDVVAAIESSHSIAWFENNNARPPAFTQRIIATDAQIAHGVYAEDLDGDGDLDILSASREDGRIAWFANQGGQYHINTQDNLTSHAIVNVTLSHRGWATDPSIELANLELRFTDLTGAPLSNETANSVVQTLQIYRYLCCSDAFDPQKNPLVATVTPLNLTVDGRQIISFVDGDANAQIAPGASVTFVVVVKLVAGVCQVSDLRINNILSARVAQDAEGDLPLLAETMPALDRDSIPQEPERPVLMINEFMASNDSNSTDPDDPTEYPDWIELYNASSSPIALGGKYLTDDLTVPNKFRIADSVVIQPKGYLVFYADGEPDQGALHTNFKLEKNGEVIGLFANAAGQEIDKRVFGPQTSNVSEGRYPDGSEHWQTLGLATPGARNLNNLLTSKLYFPLVVYTPRCQ
jgi:surface antigen